MPNPMKTFTPRSSALALSLAALVFIPHSASAKDHTSRRPQLAQISSRENAMVANALAETPDTWSTIRNFPYERRAEFNAVFARMTAKLDDQISTLNAKREKMTNDTKEWDFAMKELANARADVQSKNSELGRAANPETWTEAKGKLEVAWERAQDALEKVQASTTS